MRNFIFNPKDIAYHRISLVPIQKFVLQTSPTSLHSTITSWAEDYGLKSRIPGEYMKIRSWLF